MDDAVMKRHIKSVMTDFYSRVEVENFDKFRDYADQKVQVTHHSRLQSYVTAAISAVIIFVMLPAAWLIQKQLYSPDIQSPSKVNTVVDADDNESGNIVTFDEAYLTATALITPTDFLGYPEASRIMNQTIRIISYDPINMELTR